MPWTDETGAVHPSVGDTVTPAGVEHLYSCPTCRNGEQSRREWRERQKNTERLILDNQPPMDQSGGGVTHGTA